MFSAQRTRFWLAGSLIMVAAGCAAADATEEASEETAPDVEASAPTAAAAPASLLNPNLASADELVGAGLTADAADALVANRPFLSVAQMHEALAASIGAEAAMEAYDGLWLPINLNDVTEEEILLIPGMDDRMAHEFEEYRPYVDMDEFHREIGKYVDEDEVARLAQYVFVPVDLNDATREEIMTIPGMDDRMAHEFEEYRPYTDMDQFRREIGKYVDEAEVARFERYVTLGGM